MTATTVGDETAVRSWRVISALGVTQILAWGSTYYLPAVLEDRFPPTPGGL